MKLIGCAGRAGGGGRAISSVVVVWDWCISILAPVVGEFRFLLFVLEIDSF